MGFLQNLGEGLAEAAGNESAVSRIEKDKADRRATQHEELEANTRSILNDVQLLQQRRASLDPKSPTYQSDIGEIDAELHKARQAFTDLYHPTKNPGALAKFGGFLKSHLGEQKQPKVPKTPQEAKSRFDMAGLDAAAAGGGQTAQNPILVKRQQMKEAGFTDEQIKQVEQIDAGLQAKPTAPKETYDIVPGTLNGQPATLYRNKYDPSDWRDSSGTKVDASGFVPTPKGANAAPKVGSFGDFLIQAYGQHPTAEQYREGKRLFTPTMTTTGDHVVMVPQPDGSIKAITVQTTSTRGPAGGGSVPTTPGQAKQKAASVALKGAGVSKIGETVGGKLTAPQAKAQTEYQEAVKLDSIATQVAQKPDDAINQKRLAVALERASAGRFTTQALDYIIKAGWGNTIEQWANNPTTGALPADVLRQLVDGAHENLKAAKDARDAAGLPGGGGTASSGKGVSLAKAKQLPQNAGKSDADIKADIAKHGHQVLP